jgi:hypothetical protein
MEQLLEILFSAPEGVTMGFGPLAVAAVGAGISMLGGLFGANRAKKQAEAMEEAQRSSAAKIRAQGEQQAQARRMAEAQRIQGARAQGAAFQFGIREQRQQTALDRESALQSQYMGLAQQSRSAQSAALGSVFGALGGALIGSAGAIGGSGGFKTAAASGFTGTRKQFRLFQNTGIGKNLFPTGAI